MRVNIEPQKKLLRLWGLYRSCGFLLRRVVRATRPVAHRVASSAQGMGDIPSPVAGAIGPVGTGV